MANVREAIRKILAVQLEAIGLAVAYADLDLIPLTIRGAYVSGATPAQVRAAIEGGCFLAETPAAIRAMAREIAEAWVGRRKAVA